jgi:hypothetical protein
LLRWIIALVIGVPIGFYISYHILPSGTIDGTVKQAHDRGFTVVVTDYAQQHEAWIGVSVNAGKCKGMFYGKANILHGAYLTLSDTHGRSLGGEYKDPRLGDILKVPAVAAACQA